MSKNYPKIGIRPTIDGRQGGIREGLEEKTMNLAKAVKNLIESNLRNGDGSVVECVIADTTIGRVAESAACAEKFEREGVGSTITVTSCWCYGSETMDMNPHYPNEGRMGLQRNRTPRCRLSGCRTGCPRTEGTARLRHLRTRRAGPGRQHHPCRRG